MVQIWTNIKGRRINNPPSSSLVLHNIDLGISAMFWNTTYASLVFPYGCLSYATFIFSYHPMHISSR